MAVAKALTEHRRNRVVELVILLQAAEPRQEHNVAWFDAVSCRLGLPGQVWADSVVA